MSWSNVLDRLVLDLMDPIGPIGGPAFSSQPLIGGLWRRTQHLAQDCLDGAWCITLLLHSVTHVYVIVPCTGCQDGLPRWQMVQHKPTVQPIYPVQPVYAWYTQYTKYTQYIPQAHVLDISDRWDSSYHLWPLYMSLSNALDRLRRWCMVQYTPLTLCDPCICHCPVYWMDCLDGTWCSTNLQYNQYT